MGNCHVVGPNEVLVISGGCTSNRRSLFTNGGCGWSWWCCSDVQRLSLNVMTLLPQCHDVETLYGVALTVTAVAQVMVDTTTEAESGQRPLHKALEQFLSVPNSAMQDTILQTLEGHLRAILGTMSVEDVYCDREKFAHEVYNVAAPDLGNMGLKLLSFVIKDVTDKGQYLDSLGQKQTAIVVRDADIGRAEANRDAGIREAECKRERTEAKYSAETAIANSERQFQKQKAAFDEEVNTKRAEADLAYKLQESKRQQEIRNEEMEIQVVERRREIEVEQQEVLRKEKELIANVHRPAEAERFQVEVLAEAARTKAVLEAQGEAEGIKEVGAADAAAIQAKGEAEAAAMSARASAFKQYGDAAVMSLVLEALPKIAAEVAAPLARTKEIVMVSGNDESISGQVNKLVSQLPPAVQALTGVDVKKVLSQSGSASSQTSRA